MSSCVLASVEVVKNAGVFSSLNFDQTTRTEKMLMPISKLTEGDCRGYNEPINRQSYWCFYDSTYLIIATTGMADNRTEQ